ncbi:ArnT family glycosyltransferase [Oscillatoria salina]|uniref:ArnT family glycosyltransferase n=1 Tax=Oscillatoria salina TaxID=331517 RepID=UPI001CCAC199|nr:glycosyltransferase family 39 protein [Oscillatoria salina]MBZ8181849.1 4-amino-4-deoxy-L-arabinose transferase [Oscillatoria salina IIICB1]
MFACLPLICLIIFWLIFWSPEKDWRSASLTAAVVWGVLLAAFTEILSLFKFLTFSSVLALWLLTLITGGFIYYRLIKQKQRSLKVPPLPKISPANLVLLGGVAAIVATVGLIAVVAPPNTWDSMTYHMSRVVHWIQNRSVAHYPTYNLPQLFHPPFAEYIIMHLQILSSGDRWANLVQWFSMLGSILGVSLIAKQLGANKNGQIFAAVFCATIPMGILQSSSTQNDYAVTFWLVCLAHYILLGLSKQKPRTVTLLGIGASVGLAVLTKSSGYIFAFPFLLWFFLAKINHLRWQLWKPIFIVTAVYFSLNLGHYFRNLDLFATPLGTPDNFAVDYKMEIYTLPAFISNLIRNLAFHNDIVRYLGLEEWITPLTGKVAKLIAIIHSFLGLAIDDPRITAPAGYSVPGISFDENTAGNPLHFLLICGAISLLLIFPKINHKKRVFCYLVTLIAGLFLFSFLLKIQYYHPRHHLILFVLFSSFVGLVFEKIFHRNLLTVIAVVLIVTSLPWVFQNKFRPIFAETNIFNTSRTALYFLNRPQLEEPYSSAVEYIKRQECFDIGLSLGTGVTVGNRYWEYPLWVLFQKNNNNTYRLENIQPENISVTKSESYPHNQFSPCAIISIKDKKLQEKQVENLVIKGETYKTEWSASEDYLRILLKQ